MFYLIEKSKEGRIRLLGKGGTKWVMEQSQKQMAHYRTTSVHKFKNLSEVMAFIREHNGEAQPSIRFTSAPMSGE